MLTITQHRPAAIGEAMARGPALISAGSGWAMSVKPRPRISLAALGGGRNVLDGGLRELVRLERADLLVGAMMAEMLMMAAHLGIGVQHAGLLGIGIQRAGLLGIGIRHAGLGLRGFGSRGLRGLAGAGRHRGSSENRSGEQCCGNGLQHGCLLFQRGSRDPGRISPGSLIMLSTL